VKQKVMRANGSPLGAQSFVQDSLHTFSRLRFEEETSTAPPTRPCQNRCFQIYVLVLGVVQANLDSDGL